MKFRQWLEVQDDLQYNETIVNDFVNKMANNHENAQAIYLTLSRQPHFIENLRFKGPISNNLLKIKDDRLKDAKGEITPQISNSIFRFHTKDTLAGNLDIIHPPVIYDDIDRHLLHGVIIHELRHAQDWLNPETNFEAVSYNEFNEEAYIRSIAETRAYAEEVKDLLKRMGSSEKVLNAFNQPNRLETLPDMPQHLYKKISPFSLTPGLTAFIKELLSKFEIREWNAPKWTLPIAAAASIIPGQPTQTQQPVPIQRNMEVAEQRIANLLQKIVKKLLFRNFLIKA